MQPKDITTLKAKQNPTDPIIEINSLCKSFGSKQVLKNITFDLFNGENLVVLGKSGSGKSVLIKCIVGLLKSDGGTLKVCGQNVPDLKMDELRLLREKIGFLFQNGALYDSMTVKENLEFPLRKSKKIFSKAEIEHKVTTTLDHVGLVAELNKMPSELSGGMQKRVSLARTIILNPKIILYDEPTTGLDPITSMEMSLLINEVKNSYKTSSIIITHDIKCGLKTADRMIMLKDGEVYLEGKPESFTSSKDPFVLSFFS